jgi:hypothetical protein
METPRTGRHDLRHFERPPRRPHPLRSGGLCTLVVLTVWVGSTDAGARLPTVGVAGLVTLAAAAGGVVARRTSRSVGRAWRGRIGPIRPVGHRHPRQPDRQWA